MYDVNRKKIEQIINHLNKQLQRIKPINQLDLEQFIENGVYILAAERVLHLAIESIVDVGNYIIDGFIMRDPGGYIDIIEILIDEQVIPIEDSKKLKEIVSYRKQLVHDYTTSKPEDIYRLTNEGFNVVEKFNKNVLNYLTKELE